MYSELSTHPYTDDSQNAQKSYGTGPFQLSVSAARVNLTRSLGDEEESKIQALHHQHTDFIRSELSEEAISIKTAEDILARKVQAERRAEEAAKGHEEIDNIRAPFTAT